MSQQELKEERIVTPLNSTFMLASIIGFLASVFFIPTLPYTRALDFAWAFGLVFFGMFVASIISMTYSPHSEHLQIDEKRRIRI